MACSCKAKKAVTYVDPQTNVVKSVEVPRMKQIQGHSDSVQEVPVSHRAYTVISDQLDVSSTTKPDQLCFNCVRKHLGLAYMFSLQQDQQHYLTSLGEMLCVVTHLREKYPNLAYNIRDKVLRNLRSNDRVGLQKDIKGLVEALQKDPQQDLADYIPLPSFTQQEELLAILLVYSLLFVELSYEEVNKTWATAELSFMSYNAFRATNALQHYNTYRPLWKLIQSMNFMDENYLAARDYMYSLMVSKYPVYSQIHVPRHKEQFEEDYKKQEEMMKELNKVPSIGIVG